MMMAVESRMASIATTMVSVLKILARCRMLSVLRGRAGFD